VSCCKLNIRYFLLLLVLIAGSVYLIRPSVPQSLELKFSNGEPRQYVFVDHLKNSKRFGMIVSEALGSTLNLDWYDICFYNGSTVTQHGVITTPVTLEMVIFRLNMNKSLLELQKGLEISPPIDNEVPKTIERVISGEKIVASTGTGGCPLYIPASEGGIEYSLFLLVDTMDQYGTPIVVPVSLSNIGTLDPYPLDAGPIAESRHLSLGTTTLQVQTDPYALLVKRFVFVLLSWGLIQSVIKMWGLIFGRKKEH